MPAFFLLLLVWIEKPTLPSDQPLLFSGLIFVSVVMTMFGYIFWEFFIEKIVEYFGVRTTTFQLLLAIFLGLTAVLLIIIINFP